jgi:hypothetical protein
VSDVIEKTAAGSTRGLFGALGFILLMLGLEGMTGAAGIQFGVGIFLALLGALCFYVAFFWETAKKALSAEAQKAIGSFAQSRVTWAAVMFLVFQALILSRFFEERRWPFSYAADPAIYKENTELKGIARDYQQDAMQWRFAFNLRYGTKGDNGGLVDCKYSSVLSRGVLSPASPRAWSVWLMLGPMLEMAHWVNVPTSVKQSDLPFQGISVLSGDNKDASNCATSLGKALGEMFPKSHISVRTNQTAPILKECNDQCVELDVGD